MNDVSIATTATSVTSLSIARVSSREQKEIDHERRRISTREVFFTLPIF